MHHVIIIIGLKNYDSSTSKKNEILHAESLLFVMSKVKDN